MHRLLPLQKHSCQFSILFKIQVAEVGRKAVNQFKGGKNQSESILIQGAHLVEIWFVARSFLISLFIYLSPAGNRNRRAVAAPSCCSLGASLWSGSFLQLSFSFQQTNTWGGELMCSNDCGTHPNGITGLKREVHCASFYCKLFKFRKKHFKIQQISVKACICSQAVFTQLLRSELG